MCVWFNLWTLRNSMCFWHIYQAQVFFLATACLRRFGDFKKKAHSWILLAFISDENIDFVFGFGVLVLSSLSKSLIPEQCTHLHFPSYLHAPTQSLFPHRVRGNMSTQNHMSLHSTRAETICIGHVYKTRDDIWFHSSHPHMPSLQYSQPWHCTIQMHSNNVMSTLNCTLRPLHETRTSGTCSCSGLFSF